VATFKGSELAAGTTYTRPIENCMPALARVVVGGDYITSEGGTGLVHTAPGHGTDDYQTGVKYGLEPSAAAPGIKPGFGKESRAALSKTPETARPSNTEQVRRPAL
jgi:hypothetical protein